jgi:hypothetical protein
MFSIDSEFHVLVAQGSELCPQPAEADMRPSERTPLLTDAVEKVVFHR